MEPQEVPPVIEDLNMHSEDDDEDLPLTGQPACNQIERRRAQKAIFKEWKFSPAAQQALKPKVKDDRPNEENVSIHSLLAQEGPAIIKSPRDYQLELFERAKNENTIAVLDTGSGKTLIAVLLLRHTIDQELEDRAAGKPPKISFFLVASVTLVYQQFSVLETNLDHKIARVSGADNTDNWQKNKFNKLFSENKVIVCTAEILYQCLSRGQIRIDGINLLIFDEAHHAKKSHPYARILREFYVDADEHVNRPRIFGMTASPIDANTDITQAASELESLLYSRIATTEDMTLSGAVKRPEEFTLLHDVLSPPYATELLQDFKFQFGHVDAFERMTTQCEEIARELGRWCADHHLVDTLAEKRLKKYEGKAEQKFYGRQTEHNIKDLDSKQTDLRLAVEFGARAREEALIGSGVTESDMSGKVRWLKMYLSDHFERSTSQRCIVFVERRYTARLLDTLFRRIGSVHMRPGFLVGNSGTDGEDSVTFRQQVLTLLKFRQGEINCLFATSVAEEGLDVPDCNLVFRFDMYRSMIQYVQSRGRARQNNSKFIHFLERDNFLHRQLVSEVRFQEIKMRKFCKSLPEDRRLIGQDDSLDMLKEKEKNLRVFIDPVSKAKLTYGNSLAVLANYVAVLPSETNEMLYPVYVVSSRGPEFIAEVLLPPGAPIASSIGRVHTKKTLAKRAAAFDVCMALRKHNHLDENLMSTQRRRVNMHMNALLALETKSSKQYLMRTKPTVWEKGIGALPTELWATLLDFPDGLERAHSPLVLLTREPLPEFPSFPLFLNDSRESTVASRPLPQPLQVEDDILEKLTAFTFRVFQDVFSKKFEVDATKLSYWLAPVSATTAVKEASCPDTLLDWALLDDVHTHEDYPWTPATPEPSLIDRFFVDRYDGGRKFISLSVDPNLRPNDPVPQGHSQNSRNKENTILGYTSSLYKNSRLRREWNAEQPVIHAEKLLLRLNILATPSEKEAGMSRTRAYICPELLKISVLSPAVVTTLFVFPAVIHRFDSYLIALEAAQLIGIRCNPDVALSAVTKDCDNTEDGQNAERVNFQRGMGENYERLEFIGDTFLKTATTISTFIRNPNDLEADLHVTRMLMLCNKNLLRTALKMKLYEYVRSMSFSRRLWYPKGLKLLEGKGVKKVEEYSVIKHPLGDKTIADVCEAFIGAAFTTHNRPGKPWQKEMFDEAVHAVTVLVDDENHVMRTWDEYSAAYVKPDYQTADSTASQRDLAEKVELEHAYHFKYPRLVRSAFTHPSQPRMYEMVPNYERLEFLGDSLLDMASITHLFYRFPDKDPQWLTEHKSAMVSNKVLGAVCVKIGFHKHLRYTSAILEGQIRDYVTELREAERMSQGARDYWTTVSTPPKCLPDIVESFIGAMFIDSNFDYGVVLDFFDRHIKWYFEDMQLYDGYAKNHPCTRLHNLLQINYGCWDFQVMVGELPVEDGLELDRKDIVAVVMVHDEIVTAEKGKSGRYARGRVAEKALMELEGLTPYEFRSRFGCGCASQQVGKDEHIVDVGESVVEA